MNFILKNYFNVRVLRWNMKKYWCDSLLKTKRRDTGTGPLSQSIKSIRVIRNKMHFSLLPREPQNSGTRNLSEATEKHLQKMVIVRNSVK